jgi:hypothetical protein
MPIDRTKCIGLLFGRIATASTTVVPNFVRAIGFNGAPAEAEHVLKKGGERGPVTNIAHNVLVRGHRSLGEPASY